MANVYWFNPAGTQAKIAPGIQTSVTIVRQDNTPSFTTEFKDPQTQWQPLPPMGMPITVNVEAGQIVPIRAYQGTPQNPMYANLCELQLYDEPSPGMTPPTPRYSFYWDGNPDAHIIVDVKVTDIPDGDDDLDQP